MFSSLTIGRLAIAFYRHFIRLCARSHTDGASHTWTNDYYRCKKSAVDAARLDRQGTYDASLLAWHWRLGGELSKFASITAFPKRRFIDAEEIN